MLVSCAQMQAAEESAFARGVSAADLMEQAGCGISQVVRRYFPKPGSLLLFLGKGNNAGDALVAARELQQVGWRIYVRSVGPPESMKPLPREHWESLGDAVTVLVSALDQEWPVGPLVSLDGLLGIGASGPLRGEMASLATEMNALKQRSHAATIAMDIPSGVNGDTGEAYEGAVEADLTITVAQLKQGLVADAATGHVGRLAVVPLPELTACEGDSGACVLEARVLRKRVPVRAVDAHKGSAGRVVVVAGSRGFLGAAVLACRGALRSGAGLVTLVVAPEDYELMAALADPEVMVKPLDDLNEVLEMKADALAVGPGVGFGRRASIMSLLRQTPVPTVIDADALTMLAEAGIESLADHAGPRLLTPHPGEMARLIADRSEWADLDRRRLVEALALRYEGHTFLLKGNRTVIATKGRTTAFNSTGHPGMASGGMGDVLTGTCAAWLGQGLPPHDAASVGAWLCGRAAEVAMVEGSQAAESILASDVCASLGRALADLKCGVP